MANNKISTVKGLKRENVQVGDIFVASSACGLKPMKVIAVDGLGFEMEDSSGIYRSLYWNISFEKKSGMYDGSGILIKEKDDGTVEIYAGRRFLEELKKAKKCSA